MELMDQSLKEANERNAVKNHHIDEIFHDIAKALEFLHNGCNFPWECEEFQCAAKTSQNNRWQAKLKYVGTGIVQDHDKLLSSKDDVYTAPEAPHSTKMDVYSFGVVFLETLTKTHPFNMMDTLKVKVKQQYPKYAELVISCIEYEPSERPTIHDVLSQLDNFFVK